MHDTLTQLLRHRPVFGQGARLIPETIGIAILIYAATHFAQTYLFFARHESFIWFPGGVSLGLAQRWGRRTLPGTFIGLVAYYFLEYGLPAWASVWTSASWIISVQVFLAGMARLGPAGVFAAPIRGLLTFYGLGVVLVPALHTLLDFPLMRMAGLIAPGEDVRSYVFSYWLGEAYGGLLLAPGVYLAGQDFSRHCQGPQAGYPDRIGAEKLLWSGLAALLLSVAYYFGHTHFYAGIQDIALILYPMLAWSALRLGVAFTNLAVAVVTIAVFSFTAFGLGGTPAPETHQAMIALSSFIVTIAVMAQTLAVLDLERRLRMARLAYAADHDWLTDLDNIFGYRSVAAALIEKSKARGRAYALAYITVKEQRILEQGYGIEARNEFLRRLGEFLRRCLPAEVALARISGGNFTALFTASEPDQAREQLEEIRHRLAAFRFGWGSQSFGVTPAIRLVPIDGGIEDPDRLLEWVDASPDDAESHGTVTELAKASYAPMLDRRREKARWFAEIQDALAENRFELYAQRIQPIGAEAETRTRDGERLEILLRMRGSDGRCLAPGHFLPHAERFLLLPKIDQWVFTHVCEWFATHPACLERTAKISINLSGQSISDRAFREALQEAIKCPGIPPAKLCFEITESEAISNIELAVDFFDQLRALGCTVSLDDFGTGMSSLAYLKLFRCDYLKIDGIFVRNLTRHSTDFEIMRCIQNVAAAMGLETVAEYVELETVLNCLRELGVDYAQGYGVGKPMPLREFFRLGD